MSREQNANTSISTNKNKKKIKTNQPINLFILSSNSKIQYSMT
jgi:hypothetical protein